MAYYTLNKGQERVTSTIVYMVKNTHKQVLEYIGKAGTGKSVVMVEIARRLGIDPLRIAAMTYIGQAAIVMRLKGFPYAKTIHSTVFEPKEIEIMENGIVVIDPTFGTPKTRIIFKPKDITKLYDIFFIDEGYTVPFGLRDIILSSGKPIVVAGDWRQLPPVGDKPAFLTDRSNCLELDEIMRQKENSGIIYIADLISRNKRVDIGRYGNDCIVMYEDEINDDTLADADLIVGGTNRTRDKYNNHIRHNILHIDSDLPQVGESIICRDNDWNNTVNGISLANGLRGKVAEPIDISTFKDDHFNLTFQPDMFNAQFRDIMVNYLYLNGDKAMKEAIKHDKYANGYNFEYAYCLTSYLAQGCQAPCVVAIQDYLSSEINAHSWYTAVTRASKKLIYLIHRPKNYFQIK